MTRGCVGAHHHGGFNVFFQRSTDLCNLLLCCLVHCCTLSWVSAKLLLEWSTHRGGFIHHGQDDAFGFARGIPTGYSSTTVRAALLYSDHCFHFSQLSALVLTIPVYSLELECKLLCPACAAGSCLSLSLQVLGASNHRH